LATFGYKLFTLYLTPPRKPGDRLAFDLPQFGQERALGAIIDAADEVFNAGGDDDKGRKAYIELNKVSSQGWCSLLTASGGAYGESGEIVNVTTGQRSRLTHDDAVIHDARNLFVLPPFGDVGLLVAETRGRGTLVPSLLRRLNYQLDKIGALLRVESELADDVAWNNFLDDGASEITAVELVQHQRTADGSRLTKDAVIRGAYIRLSVEQGSIQGRLKSAVAAAKGKNPQPPNLAGVVGLRGFSDDAFDEEKVVIVDGRRERTLNVTSRWPSFIYNFSTDDRPADPADFLAEIRDSVEDTLDEMNVDRPKLDQWWPTQL
jgi:hypothetical protein